MPRVAAIKPIAHLTVAERQAVGKAVRTAVPRRAHGDWKPAPNRPDPVAILETQAATRLPELVPIRYGRMLASPFAFYRGAAAIMASDLSDGPRTSLHAQLCGDAHLSNFGVFHSPDRRMVFDINDFDETLPGPFEWDVKRLAASFAVAGRSRGFDQPTRAGIIAEVVRTYRVAMQAFSRMGNLELWYARLDIEQRLRRYFATASAAQVARAEKNLAKVRERGNALALERLTTVVDGKRKLISKPPLMVPLDQLVPPGEAEAAHETVRTLVRQYRATLPYDRQKLLERYQYADAARRVVGVGSVGTRAWVALLLGRDDGDSLFLQVKQAEASVLEPYIGRSAFAQNGRRVVDGQRIMQEASDILLGWLRALGFDGLEHDFYVRQLWDSKGSALVEELEPDAMLRYGRVCGWALAKAHARSGDAVAITAYLGAANVFDGAMVAFAETYADVNEGDYAALQVAASAGRITAQTGI